MLKNLAKKFLKNPLRFQWIIIYKFSQGISTSFSTFTEIIPPKDRFWADPFIIFKDGKYHLFFEEYLKTTQKGHLSVLTLSPDGILKKPIKIINENYHLSFPSIFEYNNKFYNIHGTFDNDKSYIEIFSSENFPYIWKKDKILSIDIPLVDTTIFFHDGLWWLFGCGANYDGTSNSNKLYLFYSENPISDKWISHPLNPVVDDVRKARPAGKIFKQNNEIIRPSQNCDQIYGNSLLFNKISKLNTKEYEEITIKSFLPNWKNNIIGLHTFNYDANCSVADIRIKRRLLF